MNWVGAVGLGLPENLSRKLETLDHVLFKNKIFISKQKAKEMCWQKTFFLYTKIFKLYPEVFKDIVNSNKFTNCFDKNQQIII